MDLYLPSASATIFFLLLKSFYHVCLYICIYIFILYCFLFLIIRNFNLPSLWAPLCLNPKCIVFLCAPSCLVLNQVMPLFLSYGLFFTLNQFTPNLSLFCLAAVSPAISQCVFLFEILRVFFINSNIYIYIYTYFSFLFLNFRVKNHICFLWNPNICFNNNNNNNDTQSKTETSD